MKGILKGQLLSFFDCLVALAAFLYFIPFFPGVFAVLINMMALITGDFVLLDMFQMRKVHSRLAVSSLNKVCHYDLDRIRGLSAA
jgi:hypothetical protein